MDSMNSGSWATYSAREYEERIPRRIASLITGYEKDVEAALASNDTRTLMKLAGTANAITIGGRKIAPEEVEISPAPIREEILGEDRSSIQSAREELISGRIVAQLFFAGAATRFRKVSRGLLYFLDIWKVASRVLEVNNGEVPDIAEGMSLKKFQQIRRDIAEAASALPEGQRLSVPLGARILISYRMALDGFARQMGKSPEEVRRRARFCIHIPNSPGGMKMVRDISSRKFFGFEHTNVLFIRQPLFAGFQVSGETVAPIPGSEKFPYGHGYSTVQLAQPGAAEWLEKDALVKLEADPLEHLAGEGSFMVRTHRVNDLTQLTPAILDPERLAVGRKLMDRGHVAVIELVKNPSRQKGGNWLELRARGHRFLLEKMNAEAGNWPQFMKQLDRSPYNAFRNMYNGEELRQLLLDNMLPDHLRIREGDNPDAATERDSKTETPRVGLYLESVTGDITHFPDSRAAAFRYDQQETIHDLKELKDLPEGVKAARINDFDGEFRALAEEYGY